MSTPEVDVLTISHDPSTRDEGLLSRILALIPGLGKRKSQHGRFMFHGVEYEIPPNRKLGEEGSVTAKTQLAGQYGRHPQIAGRLIGAVSYSQEELEPNSWCC